MSKKKTPNYSRGIIIVHGKSERILAKHITTNLHLNMGTIGKEKGKKSLELSSILSFLNKPPLATFNALTKEYVIECNKKELKNFKVFIILDVDKYEELKDDYMNKRMFKNHWLYPYIVPIINDPCLEDVLFKAGIITEKIKGKDKVDTYFRIFPIQDGGKRDEEQVKLLKDKLSGVKETNLEIFLDYCLQQVKKKNP